MTELTGIPIVDLSELKIYDENPNNSLLDVPYFPTLSPDGVPLLFSRNSLMISADTERKSLCTK